MGAPIIHSGKPNPFTRSTAFGRSCLHRTLISVLMPVAFEAAEHKTNTTDITYATHTRTYTHTPPHNTHNTHTHTHTKHILPNTPQAQAPDTYTHRRFLLAKYFSIKKKPMSSSIDVNANRARTFFSNARTA